MSLGQEPHTSFPGPTLELRPTCTPQLPASQLTVSCLCPGLPIGSLEEVGLRSPRQTPGTNQHPEA